MIQYDSHVGTRRSLIWDSKICKGIPPISHPRVAVWYMVGYCPHHRWERMQNDYGKYLAVLGTYSFEMPAFIKPDLTNFMVLQVNVRAWQVAF